MMPAGLSACSEAKNKGEPASQEKKREGTCLCKPQGYHCRSIEGSAAMCDTPAAQDISTSDSESSSTGPSSVSETESETASSSLPKGRGRGKGGGKGRGRGEGGGEEGRGEGGEGVEEE